MPAGMTASRVQSRDSRPRGSIKQPAKGTTHEEKDSGSTDNAVATRAGAQSVDTASSLGEILVSQPPQKR